MTGVQICFFPYQTLCHAASGEVLSQSLAPNLRSRHVTIKLLAVLGSAPNPPAGPAPQPHPPSLITRGLASRDVASPLPLPASPRFYYLLAVHFQILSIDLHPHNDHLVIPFPPDGCVPEAAHVQRVVDTPDDLGSRRASTRVPTQKDNKSPRGQA